MSTSPLFNPTAFFLKAAYYPSQGRGQFKISAFNPTHVLETANGMDSNLIAKGRDALLKGWAAKSFTVPSMQLNTYEAFSYMGPTKKMPYGLQFSDMQVEFYLMGSSVDEARALHYTMSRWVEAIAGPRRTGDSSINDSQMPVSDSTVFEVEYYTNYVVDAEVFMYTPTGTVTSQTQQINTQNVIHIKFSELYPIEVGSIQSSWESPDAPATMSVTFAYHYSRVLPS